uniref:WD_REPEATS_REGION domain-containing protein n=1 Tax=Steinernema glaseri TaxID=37863 RepID=A0A1I8A262_9BILA
MHFSPARILLLFFCLFTASSARVVPSVADPTSASCFDRSGAEVCAWYRDRGFCSEKIVQTWMREGCERTYRASETRLGVAPDVCLHSKREIRIFRKSGGWSFQYNQSFQSPPNGASRHEMQKAHRDVCAPASESPRRMESQHHGPPPGVSLEPEAQPQAEYQDPTPEFVVYREVDLQTLQNPQLYEQHWLEGDFGDQGQLLEVSENYAFVSDEPGVYQLEDGSGYVYATAMDGYEEYGVEMADVELQAGVPIESDDEIIDVVNGTPPPQPIPIGYIAEEQQHQEVPMNYVAEEQPEQTPDEPKKESGEVLLRSCLVKDQRQPKPAGKVHFANKYRLHELPGGVDEQVARMSMHRSEVFIRKYSRRKMWSDRNRGIPLELKFRRSNASVSTEDYHTSMELQPPEGLEELDPWKPQFRCCTTLYGHQRGITRVRFSPDGRLLASASNDSTIKVWSFDNEALENTFIGHRLAINDIAWFPDSRNLLSASSDGTLILWDIKECMRLHTFEGHEEAVLCCAVDPHEGRRAASSSDEFIRVWDIVGRSLLFELERHDSIVTSLSFHKDGIQLASTGMDGHILLWDTETGEPLDSFLGTPGEDFQEPLSFIQYTRNGKFLLTSSLKSELKLWNVEKKTVVKKYKGYVNERGYLTAGFLTSKGRPTIVLSGSEDEKVRVWNVNTMQIIQTIPVAEDGNALAVDVHPDRFIFACASASDRDAVIRVLHAADNQTKGSQHENPAILAPHYAHPAGGGGRIDECRALPRADGRRRDVCVYVSFGPLVQLRESRNKISLFSLPMGRHSRSRSRSRDRRRRSRSRSYSRREHRHRDRSREKRRRRRHRSGSEEEFQRRRKERSPSPPGPSPSIENEASTSGMLPPVAIPAEISKELYNKEKTNVEELSKAAKDWLDNRVLEQVKAQVGDFNALLEERLEQARADMEIHLRQQIEQEMRHEVDEYRKKEEDSRKRCEALEAELRAKLKALEESEMKVKEERLRMLEVKSKLEAERQELQKERMNMNKAEQCAILNKGGLRAPIKLKFGGK